MTILHLYLGILFSTIIIHLESKCGYKHMITSLHEFVEKIVYFSITKNQPEWLGLVLHSTNQAMVDHAEIMYLKLPTVV